MFLSGNMIIVTQCCVFITESLNFITAKLLDLATHYTWYHMAHADPDTSSLPSLNHQLLKHIGTTWIQTHKSVPVYMGLHIIQCTVTWSCVTAWTSRQNVSRRFLNVSSRSRLSLETLTSRCHLGLGIISLDYNPAYICYLPSVCLSVTRILQHRQHLQRR